MYNNGYFGQWPNVGEVDSKGLLFFILHTSIIFNCSVKSIYAFTIRILIIFETYVLFKTHKTVNEIQKTVSKNCQVLIR